TGGSTWPTRCASSRASSTGWTGKPLPDFWLGRGARGLAEQEILRRANENGVTFGVDPSRLVLVGRVACLAPPAFSVTGMLEGYCGGSSADHRSNSSRTEMGSRLYIGNLPYSVTELDLRDLFGEIGSVAEVKV